MHMLIAMSFSLVLLLCINCTNSDINKKWFVRTKLIDVMCR